LRRLPGLIARFHAGPPVLKRHPGADTATSPEQSRADGQWARRSQPSLLSRINALRGQQVQSKVSNLKGISGLSTGRHVWETLARTTPRMFSEHHDLYISEIGGVRSFLG
jgi:hypothetical protein